MARKFGGLGRGLGALIPQKDDTTSQPAPSAPSRASVVIGGNEMSDSEQAHDALAAVAPAMHEPTAVQNTPAAAASDDDVVSAPYGAAAPAVADRELPLHLIVADPHQPRKLFKHKELEELAQSIREHGIIQPLTVAPRADGKFDLIAGERRFRAAGLLGLASVPVTMRAVEPQDKLLVALIENIQREDLNPIEEAESYRRLITEFSLTQEDVARKVGKARSTVANTLRLLELPQEVRDGLAQGLIPAGSARAILGLKDSESQLRLYKRLITEHLTTRDVEEGIRRRSRRPHHRDPELAAVEERLREVLGSRVDVASRAGRGTITISFFSDEERDDLVSRLGA